MSPDGTTLAVLAWAAEPKPRQARIFSVGVDGSNYREIVGPFRFAPGTMPEIMRWTPDGRTIVFVAGDENDSWRLMRVPAEGGQAEFDGLDVRSLSPLLSGLRIAPVFYHFDLSPDGSRASINTLTEPTAELWALDNLLSVVNSK